jgi:hypothetical protein
MADAMSIELISGVAAASAGLSGTGVWGVLKLLDLRRDKNGSRPVTDEQCRERLCGTNGRLDRLDRKVEQVISILMKGAME